MTNEAYCDFEGLIAMKNQKYIIWIIVIISVLAIVFAPYLLTSFGCDKLSFLNKEKIGDTIGGITSPIVGIVSIVLLAYTLIEQLNFNVQQVNLQCQEQFKSTFFQLLQEQREITNSLFTTYEGVDLKNPAKTVKCKVGGQEFFRMGAYILKNLFESMEYGHYCHSYDSDVIINQMMYLDECSENYFEDKNGKLYSFDFNVLKKNASFCFLNDKYKITKDEFESYKHLTVEQKIDFIYRRFFNVHEECGNYFRHLYRILYFVEQSEGEEQNEAKDEELKLQISKRYYDLAQFIQAQMSTRELLMVFYNSFSFPNLKRLLIKYNILENLRAENLIDSTHDCVNEYHLKHKLE